MGTHIQKLLMKTSVRSRAELVARAYRTGLVSSLHDRRNGHQSRLRPLALVGAES